MPFSNPITGAQGALVRPAIKSPDYVPGVSGWSINKDGTAEFNDVEIRGSAESANYVPGVSGWRIDQDGSAEFNDAELRGTLSVGGDPDTDPSVTIFPETIPPEIVTLLSPRTVVGVIIYRRSATLYLFDALCYTTGRFSTVRGGFIGASGAVMQDWTFNTVSAGGELTLAQNILNQSLILGDQTNAGIRIRKAPLLTTPQIDIGVANGNLGAINITAPSLGSVAVSAGSIGLTGTTAVTGTLNSSDEAFDTVGITPVANTPTSASVSYPTLAGTGTICGWATPNTSVIGSTVMGTSVSSLTATSMNVVVYRTNTTGTGVFWRVKRKA